MAMCVGVVVDSFIKCVVNFFRWRKRVLVDFLSCGNLCIILRVGEDT
jgi:hypothetical protein